MKKFKRLFVLVLLVSCICLFVGCGGKKVTGIEFNNNTEVSIDDFDFDSADFSLIYEDGSKETIKGSELGISDEDAGNLVEEGIYEVTLTYNKESFKTKIALTTSSENIVKPNTACYVYSDSHYIEGKQYTSICVGGKDEGQFIAFEFKLNYDKNTVKDINIIPASDYRDKLEINNNGDRISVNFVDNIPGPMNTELFRIEYTSPALYKNFSLDTTSEYGFYKFANKDIYNLNCTFSLNW